MADKDLDRARKRSGPRRRAGLRTTCRVAAIAIAFSGAGVSPAAWGQNDTRGKPVLRTPRPQTQARPGAPVTPAQPAQPGAQPGGNNGAAPPAAPTQANAPGAPGAPGGKPLDPNDPMSKVAQGAQEIDFQPKPAGYEVSFNLDDADLPELVKAISNITGRRFIYGGKLRSIKATVYSPEKVTAAEAYAAFLSILETNGLTVIPHGRFLKIVESPGVVQQTTPIYGTAAPVPFEDRYVTRLYRLRHVSADEVANVLNRFKTKDGDITVYSPGNLLIITETGSNIRRMLRIVEEVDVGSAGDQLFVHPVHYGSAEEMAAKLNEILGGGAGGAGSNILADPHTNSLIVTSTKEDYERLLELLKRLDVPQSGEGQIHVLPLQHATCDDLSATLNGILGGAATGGAAGGAPAGGRAGGRGGAPAPTGSPEEIFEGAVKVTCDEATNSMVTTSSLRDYAQLRKVIDDLDKPRRQVFIEAVIMDVNVDRSFNWGIGYHGGSDFAAAGDQGFVYGGNNPGQSILGVPARLEALALGVRGPEIDGSNNVFAPGVSIPALGVVLHALAEDGDSNVLATPHILATDNIPAEISIGQNIPLQTNVGGGNLASLAQAAGGAQGAGAAGLGALLGGGLGFNAPRQDVGTKISVTPHVNDSDQVRLELVEEISDAGAPTGDLGAVPINKRTANTTLIVKDQQTVVIGGLVRDAFVVGETKIPILGDIPVLGFLFKQHQRQKTKTNLLLILTPHVIRSQDDLREIFERKMQERQEFLDRYFVFNDISDWDPPRDFSRANGLVEYVRQEQIAMEERAALEAALVPDEVKTHEPTKAIQLPSIGSKVEASAPARPTKKTNPPAATTPAPATNPGANRPSLRVPGRPTPTPTPNQNQKVNRVEE